MRQGSTFKRCTECGKKVDAKQCACGSKSSTWAFIVDVSPPGAPRQQKRRGGFTTKAAALDAMAELQQAHTSGQAVEASKLTLGGWLDQWLAATEPPNAPRGRKPIRRSTWTERRSRMTNHIIPALGSVPLQQVTDSTLDAHYQHLEREGGRGGKGLARSTVAGVHLVLHAALEDAVRARLLVRNVADGLYAAPSEPEQERAVWAAQELSAFLDSVKGDEHFALWRTAAMTGARRSELLALRWRDVDLVAATLTINRGRVKSDEGTTVAGTKSARSRRTVDIDPLTVEALRQHRAGQQVIGINGLCFTYADGSPVDPDGISQRFNFRVKQSGVSRITFHGLRHTHATLLLQRGVPLHVVSRRLGHSSEAFTAKQYAHVLPGQQADAVALLAAAVDRG